MITIELPDAIAQRILPMLKAEREMLEIQIRKIEASLSGATAQRTNGSQFTGTLPLLSPEKTKSGRSKSGASERLIVEYMKGVPRGSAVKEISDATNTAYGSCLRILKKLESKNLVSVRKRLWSWVGKESGPRLEFAAEPHQVGR